MCNLLQKKFKPTLSQLFYFYENSPVRMSGLKAIQELLESVKLKLEKPADTRWLSHDHVCCTLIKILPSVIVSLSREAEERGDALALGLHKVVQQYNLYMMTDVLPIVSRLSRILQASSIDLCQLHQLVESTLLSLRLLLVSPGPQLVKLDSDLEGSLSQFAINVNADMKKQFQDKIHKPFIEALLNHIKERLPDTGIFTAFSVFDPKRLPATAERAALQKYGEIEVEVSEIAVAISM